MKMYERIENNNFEEIDKDRAIELIKNGNGHLVYNQSYFDLQKENEELKAKYDKHTHRLQNDLDIANAKIVELFETSKILEDDIKDKRFVYIDTPEFEENYIPVQEVKDLKQSSEDLIDASQGCMSEEDLLQEHGKIKAYEELLEGRK